MDCSPPLTPAALLRFLLASCSRPLPRLLLASCSRPLGLVLASCLPHARAHSPLALVLAHPFAQLTTPLLKLYAELVYNKAQRLTFDSSSPNGILLFRDASAILVAYGSRMQEKPVAVGADPYTSRYKGVSLCMLLLTRALSGNYVNFGVFALYGDRALADCLEVRYNLRSLA